MLGTPTNTGIMLNTEFTDDYTIEADVRVAKNPGVGVTRFVLGTRSDNWVYNSSIAIIFRNWSDGFYHFLIHKGQGDLAGIISSDAMYQYDGGFNHIVINVDFDGGKQYLDVMLNGVLVISGHEMEVTETTGNYFAITNYYDREYTPDEIANEEGGVVKNLEITYGGQTTTYFVDGAWEAPAPDTADIEVIAIAGSMIAMLIAAAFVIKARKA